jgi:hypothetical protein
VLSKKPTNKMAEVVLSVGLLAFLSLLVGNVVIMLMAARLNDTACQQAAQLAAEAYDVSGNPRDLQTAVINAMSNKISGGFFVSNPMLAELRCYTDTNKGHKRQMLLVKTTISVHVPAPYLVFFSEPLKDGSLVLNSKCIVELKPASLPG